MSTPGLVCVVLGAPRAGSTSLVRDLGRVMSDSYVAFPAGGTMVDSAPVDKQTGIWEQRLRAQFRAHMKALRIAAAGTGVILDGSIGQLMAQIEMEHKHARLAPDAARIMIAFGQQLLQRTPHPNVVVHLDTTPASLVARPSQNESLLALDDHRILDACVREVVDALATKENGVELYRRKWDHFGKTSAVRVHAHLGSCARERARLTPRAPCTEAACSAHDPCALTQMRAMHRAPRRDHVHAAAAAQRTVAPAAVGRRRRVHPRGRMGCCHHSSLARFTPDRTTLSQLR
jgi:hypothetical protein